MTKVHFQELALQIAAREGRVTPKRLAEYAVIRQDNASYHIAQLVKRGELVGFGNTTTRHYKLAGSAPNTPEVSPARQQEQDRIAKVVAKAEAAGTTARQQFKPALTVGLPGGNVSRTRLQVQATAEPIAVETNEIQEAVEVLVELAAKKLRVQLKEALVI